MFTQKEIEKSGLELAIEELHNEMRAVEGDSEEYGKMADNLTKLYKLREHDARRRVSPDTLAVVAGNLGVAAMIIAFEKHHVITTKLPSFLMKLR